jgi:hypothetical protein
VRNYTRNDLIAEEVIEAILGQIGTATNDLNTASRQIDQKIRFAEASDTKKTMRKSPDGDPATIVKY